MAKSGWVHYKTVIGYDDAAQTIWVYDTYAGQGPTYDGIPITYGEFDSWWRHFNRVFLVVYPQGREDEVAAILGDYTDPTYAAEAALAAAQAEAARRNDAGRGSTQAHPPPSSTGTMRRRSTTRKRSAWASVPHVVVPVRPVRGVLSHRPL